MHHLFFHDFQLKYAILQYCTDSLTQRFFFIIRRNCRRVIPANDFYSLSSIKRFLARAVWKTEQSCRTLKYMTGLEHFHCRSQNLIRQDQTMPGANKKRQVLCTKGQNQVSNSHRTQSCIGIRNTFLTTALSTGSGRKRCFCHGLKTQRKPTMKYTMKHFRVDPVGFLLSSLI